MESSSKRHVIGIQTSGMAGSGSTKNDDIKHRILKVYAKFVSDVEPVRLSDWLVEGGVISIEEWERISRKNLTSPDKCRALLSHLFSTQHPRAFLIVRDALLERNHYLIEYIDNQESECEFHAQPDTETSSQDKKKREQLEKDYEDQKRAWEAEKDRLLKTQKELESKLNLNKLRYESDPVLDQTITTKAAEEENKAIVGLTILDNELFVVSGDSSEVEVYDSIKLSFSRRWNLKELIKPNDIASCNRNKCLYIIDYRGYGYVNEILRIDINGKLIKNWSTGDHDGSLSVTDESNVIYMEYKLNEYSPDGQLIREINLSLDALTCSPLHAVKLTSGHFVVSHGSRYDELHRVCVVDADGNLKKSFGGQRGSNIGQMNFPSYLSVDGNGFVLVADTFNSRVLLLDSDLEFKREILSEEKHGLGYPNRILLDESNGRVFVVNNGWDFKKDTYASGYILIFNFK